MEKFITICPQCGSIKHGETNCEYCGIPLVKTNMTIEEYQQLDRKQITNWEKQALTEYAPNRSNVAIENRVAMQRKVVQSEEELVAKTYIPKCPTCGCPDISRIPNRQSSLDINNSIMAIVTNRTGKTFVCNNCGYTW